jgi:hypothetical protein
VAPLLAEKIAVQIREAIKKHYPELFPDNFSIGGSPPGLFERSLTEMSRGVKRMFGASGGEGDQPFPKRLRMFRE